MIIAAPWVEILISLLYSKKVMSAYCSEIKPYFHIPA